MSAINRLRFGIAPISVICLYIAGIPAQADQVFLDDVIVDGSLCVGQDCANGENFGFDTIRLKENNLRIKAQDTSITSSFPSNDWQITFNDSSNGGQNKFSIDDIDGGRTPFTIEAGAPSHSLYVDDGGRIGLGTSTPVVQLHQKDGNTPTLRLEQDGSSGFAAQTWDIAGNETNFFIRDASNGSTLPLRIFPNAPSNALIIEGTTGDIGLGIQSPSAPLHLNESAETGVLNPHVLVENVNGTDAQRHLLALANNGTIYASLTDTSVAAGNNTGRQWNIFNNNGSFRITTAPGGLGEEEFQLDADGNIIITGTITTAGSCAAGCDRVFEADYPLLSIAENARYMWDNKHLPAVGATAEDGPFNLTDKVGGMLNELEKAHIYIDQLNKRIDALETIINAEKG